MERILIVEDEKDVNRLLAQALQDNGYETVSVYNGLDVINILSEGQFGMVLLDLMLPYKSGDEVLKDIRNISDIPVIVISARDMVRTKVDLLAAGADDYITKPFNILEVKARIKAIIRRSSVSETKEPPKVYSYNGLRIDIESRRAYINDKEVNLTAKEFDLLELLMLHPNKVYGREELLNTVWGYDYPGDVRTVDVHIRRLREKIEESPSNPVFIHTKWGVGYYFQK